MDVTESLKSAKLWHKMTGNEYFILNDGTFWPWHWFLSHGKNRVFDIVETTGDGLKLEEVLTKIEKQRVC